jgi:RimJ/RimL family protein N-acetyltransferase
MINKQKIILKGDGFILRPIKMADASNWAKWSKDKKTVQYTSIVPLSLPKEKEWIKKTIKNKTDFTFGVVLDDGTHIGGAGLHFYPTHQKAMLGIVIGDPKYHDKGYGTKIVKILLKFGFEKLKLNKIELTVFVKNPRAQKVYRRCGFKKEGLLRDHVSKYGKFHDEYIMGILKSEYFKKYKK